MKQKKNKTILRKRFQGSGTNQNRALLKLGLIILLGLLIRLYKLDSLPGEMWGDVIEHFQMAKDILNHHFFLYYRFGGDGPLFSYLLALWSKFFGLSFYSIKLVTVFIGTALVFLTYYFSIAFFKKRQIGYIASFLTGVSFWSLSFSRQAKPHILVPLFVVLTFIFYLQKKEILGGIVLGLGMYVQAGFWGVPLFFLLVRRLKMVFIAGLVSIPLLESMIGRRRMLLNSNSFFGEKLGFGSISWVEFFYKLLINFNKNILAFFTKGDGGFRHTIPYQPHLDLISRLFFLLGLGILLVRILKGKDKRIFFNFILAFFIIQIPSLLDVKNPLSIPNMGRMIGIIPFVYTLVAYGIYQFSIRVFHDRRKNLSFMGVVLIGIFFINFYQYFFVYPKFLPNKNTPFGKIIAQEIDQYPLETKVFVVGCCWGDWGQPELGGIIYRLKTNRSVRFINPDILKVSSSLDFLNKRKTIVFIAPNRSDLVLEMKKKFNHLQVKKLTKNGYQVALVVKR